MLTVRSRECVLSPIEWSDVSFTPLRRKGLRLRPFVLMLRWFTPRYLIFPGENTIDIYGMHFIEPSGWIFYRLHVRRRVCFRSAVFHLPGRLSTSRSGLHAGREACTIPKSSGIQQTPRWQNLVCSPILSSKSVSMMDEITRKQDRRRSTFSTCIFALYSPMLSAWHS